VITHAELTTGQQIAQVAHAVAEFALRKQDAFQHWHTTSQFLVALAATNEERLQILHNTLQQKKFQLTEFREPDLNDALTAVALTPHPQLKRMLSDLPLAGKVHITHTDERSN
jgi:hypothetical protein